MGAWLNGDGVLLGFSFPSQNSGVKSMLLWIVVATSHDNATMQYKPVYNVRPKNKIKTELSI
jgi:hypothetical protein